MLYFPLTRLAATVAIAVCGAGMLTACDCTDCTYHCVPPNFCDSRLNDAGGKGQELAYAVGVERADEVAATGNAVLSEGGSLGGIGHVSVDIRAKRISRSVPRLAGTAIQTDDSAPLTDIPSTGVGATAVSADFALGLLRGLKLGRDSRIGDLDLLGSVTELQGYGDTDLHLKSSNQISFGIGARIGLLAETSTLPGISYSRWRRSVPRISFRASPVATADGGMMTIGVDQLDVTVNSWRVAASKKLGRFGVTAGIGRDTYDASYTYYATLDEGSSPGANGSQSTGYNLTRKNLFVGASYALSRMTLAGEFGRLSGAAAISYLSAAPATPSRSYASIGVLMGW